VFGYGSGCVCRNRNVSFLWMLQNKCCANVKLMLAPRVCRIQLLALLETKNGMYFRRGGGANYVTNIGRHGGCERPIGAAGDMVLLYAS
jgi:hypothetical protein